MCDLGCNPLFENVAPLEKRTDQGHGHRHFPTMIPHVIFRTTRKQYQIWRNSAAQNEEDTKFEKVCQTLQMQLRT